MAPSTMLIKQNKKKSPFPITGAISIAHSLLRTTPSSPKVLQRPEVLTPHCSPTSNLQSYPKLHWHCLALKIMTTALCAYDLSPACLCPLASIQTVLSTHLGPDVHFPWFSWRCPRVFPFCGFTCALSLLGRFLYLSLQLNSSSNATSLGKATMILWPVSGPSCDSPLQSCIITIITGWCIEFYCNIHFFPSL